MLTGITDKAKTFLTHNEKIQINDIADVTFNNKRFQPKNTKEKETFKLDEITQATDAFRKEVENLLKDREEAVVETERARNNKGQFVGDDPETLEDESKVQAQADVETKDSTES